MNFIGTIHPRLRQTNIEPLSLHPKTKFPQNEKAICLVANLLASRSFGSDIGHSAPYLRITYKYFRSLRNKRITSQSSIHKLCNIMYVYVLNGIVIKII